MNNSYLATTYLVVWMLIAVIPVSKLWPSACRTDAVITICK